MKNKSLIIIIFLLIAGLYVNLWDDKDRCLAAYAQPSFVIGIYKPFALSGGVEFSFGYGKKINSLPVQNDSYKEFYKDGEVFEGYSAVNACPVYTKNAKLTERSDRYHIDLKFWEKAK